MTRTLIALATVLGLTPLVANAQTYASPEAFNQVVRPRAGIMGDVGVSRYDRALAVQTEPGVAYGVHLELSPARSVTVELGYAGALNDLNDKYSTDGRLVTNAVGGNLRVNFVPPGYDLPGGLQPFIFGGVTYHRITTQNFTPGIKDANAVGLPFGGGLEVNVGDRVLVGARYTYNLLFNADENFAGGNADNWMATVNVGARLAP